MRKYLVLSALGACLVAFVPAASAFAGGSTYYAGKNSQGQKLLFSVDHTASGPKFDPIFINQIDHCPVTGDTIAVEFSFQGFQIPIVNGKFSLVMDNIFQRFSWTGTVTSTGASGKENIDLPAFDNTGGLQDCGAGVLSWKAQALVPASATAHPSAQYVVTLTRASDGSVQYSITH